MFNHNVNNTLTFCFGRHEPEDENDPVRYTYVNVKSP